MTPQFYDRFPGWIMRGQVVEPCDKLSYQLRFITLQGASEYVVAIERKCGAETTIVVGDHRGLFDNSEAAALWARSDASLILGQSNSWPEDQKRVARLQALLK